MSGLTGILAGFAQYPGPSGVFWGFIFSYLALIPQYWRQRIDRLGGTPLGAVLVAAAIFSWTVAYLSFRTLR